MALRLELVTIKDVYYCKYNLLDATMKSNLVSAIFYVRFLKLYV